MSSTRAQIWGSAAQWISAGAAIIAAVAAIVGLTFIANQVETIQKNAVQAAISAREQSARSVYVQYMNWGFQNPEFTAKPVRYADFKDHTLLKYEWFVLNFLFAYDEIFEANKSDQTWKEAFLWDAPSHISYICEHKDSKLTAQFFEFTRSLILEAAREAGFQTCNGTEVPPKRGG